MAMSLQQLNIGSETKTVLVESNLPTPVGSMSIGGSVSTASLKTNRTVKSYQQRMNLARDIFILFGSRLRCRPFFLYLPSFARGSWSQLVECFPLDIDGPRFWKLLQRFGRLFALLPLPLRACSSQTCDWHNAWLKYTCMGSCLIPRTGHRLASPMMRFRGTNQLRPFCTSILWFHKTS